MVSDRTSATPVFLDAAGKVPVVVTPPDFDRFVLSQREAVEAAQKHRDEREARREVGEHLAALVYRVHDWCRSHDIASCVAAPRMDDLLLVITARDEDPGGSLHDDMSKLDLESFEKNGLRLSWLLLRASEAAGISAFVDPAVARTIYRADN